VYIELYDLESDPYELESIHEGADPALVEALKTCFRGRVPGGRGRFVARYFRALK